jgi:NAD+ synthase (glutamine-hydrolysing)
MTYQELTIFGRLRKLNKLGPFAMFQRLVHDWSIDRERTADDDAPYYTPAQVAEKVKRFFHYYAINRTSSLQSSERETALLMAIQGTK